MLRVIVNKPDQIDSQIEQLRMMLHNAMVPNSLGQVAPLEINADPIEGKKRTPIQNNCLHLYCTQLAKAFNDAGLDQRAVLKEEAEIPWDMKAVKNQLWRSLQKAMFDKESTTDLSTTETQEVYQTLSQHLAMKFGVSVPWPNRFGN